MIARSVLVGAFERAVAHHHDALPAELAALMAESGYADRPRLGLAIGKAALPMARAFGAVERGVIVSPHDDGQPMPRGWGLLVSSHPIPDERAQLAGEAAIELVGEATLDRVVAVLISGGASALVEAPLLPISELVRITSALMRLGAPIEELNVVRSALSRLKGGGLAARCAAPVVTLAISDVVTDDLATIGSGPTIGPWLAAPDRPHDLGAMREAHRRAAIDILNRHELEIPRVLEKQLVPEPPVMRRDFARVVVPMHRFARAVWSELEAGLSFARRERPLTHDVAGCADAIAAFDRPTVSWGEPTLVVPPSHGAGGRMQQLALELAKRLAGTPRSALAIGSDGMDGPAPPGRPAPAGAFVDGTTWQAIARTGLDPQAALDLRDAGTALHAVGALVITGPTGVNHADLVVIG